MYIYTLVLQRLFASTSVDARLEYISRETVKKLYFYAHAALIMNQHIIQAPSTHYLDNPMASSTRPAAGAGSTYKRSRAGQSTEASSGRRRQSSR